MAVKLLALTCRYCGVRMVRDGARGRWQRPPNMLTRQHIIARRLGGTSSRENLRPCCLRCNGLLDLANDCPGALACAQAVARAMASWPRGSAVRRVLLAWRRQALAEVPF